MYNNHKSMRQVWVTLALPPILFLLVIIAVSVYFGVITPGDAQAITESVPRAAPYIVLIVQLLLIPLLRTLRTDGLTLRAIGWQLPADQQWWREGLLGVLVGPRLGCSISLSYHRSWQQFSG